MSYDIFFQKRDKTLFNVSELEKYFRSRQNYEISNNQTHYSNEDTGVYFIIEWTNDSIETVIEKPNNLHSLILRLNLFRPHVFALEAEVELKPLIECFDLLIIDIQINDKNAIDFDSEQFINSYNKCNKASYNSLIQIEDDVPECYFLPTSKIESIWRWNYERRQFYAKMGEDYFMPLVIYHLKDKVIKTSVIWIDDVPAFLPIVDIVFNNRVKYSPKKYFRKINQLISIDYDDLQVFLSDFETKTNHLDYKIIEFKKTPELYVEFIKNHLPYERELKFIDFDKVLNQEYVIK